jgi:hypothetical protein
VRDDLLGAGSRPIQGCVRKFGAVLSLEELIGLSQEEEATQALLIVEG